MANNSRKDGGNPVRVVSLVDASRWQKILLALRMLLEGQIEPANVICINKIDLVDADELDNVEHTVREMNANAPIIRVSAAAPMSETDLDTLIGK